MAKNYQEGFDKAIDDKAEFWEFYKDANGKISCANIFTFVGGSLVISLIVLRVTDTIH